MENFEIKRGMVFFIDMTKIQPTSATGLVPTKVRPYVVLSNDLCNQSSPTIHVAPIYTKAYKDTAKKWYLIPFKETDNRESAVDIASIMLVPKAYCKSTNYNMTLTNLVRYNKNLFEMIDAAICKQFAVSVIQTRPEVEKTMQEHPVYNAPIPVVPNITLNISVNGVPVSPDSVSIESSVSDTDKSANDTKIIESVSNADKDYDSKIILGDTENKTDKVEASDYSNIKVSKFKRHGRSFSKKQINTLKKFIIDNHRDFNGDMTYYRIGKIFGISLTAVQKYAEEAKADFGKSDNGKNVKHTGKPSMLPKELYSEFLDFYVNHTMGETLEKYAKYGYTKASQIKDKLYSIRKELNTYKVKRRNGSVATVKKNK